MGAGNPTLRLLGALTTRGGRSPVRLRHLLIGLACLAVAVVSVASPWRAPAPAEAESITGLSASSPGASHMCAVTGAGTAKCWGNNSEGQLGNGTVGGQEDGPVDVCSSAGCGSLLTGVVAMALGAEHTCALMSGGTVKCWGDNGAGQLGDGNSPTSSALPVDVCLSAGCGSSLSGVLQVTGGDGFTCALMSGGTVKCWGDNGSGQLGDNNAPTGRDTPDDVCSDASCTGDLTGAVFISAGGQHVCARVGSEARCWGENAAGQLGDGNAPTDSDTPVSVCAVGGCGGGNLGSVITVGGGGGHSCATVQSTFREARCWGDNASGQLGDNNAPTDSDTPVAVCADASCTGNLEDVNIVGGGADRSCALMLNGSAKCWGENDQGQLGDGNAPTDSDTPVDVCAGACTKAGLNYISGALGSKFGCAVTEAGNVLCAGDNLLGQLGNDDSPNDSDTLVPVTGLGSKGLVMTVNSTGDGSDSNAGNGVCDTGTGTNVCTLRAAIQESNALATTDVIEFSISGVGPHVITPSSLLPSITSPVIIDATTEPDFQGAPLVPSVQVDGSSLGSGSGINIQGGGTGSDVLGLAITNFPSRGINMDSGSNFIAQNYIGLDPFGEESGNGTGGVRVNGGGSTILGNRISANSGPGIQVVFGGATIVGNDIGPDTSFTFGAPNSGGGIVLDAAAGSTIGGAAPGEGNLISGNTGPGIEINAGSHTMIGNDIGTGLAGLGSIPNTSHGIQIDGGSNSIIGGTSDVQANTIGNNGGDGIFVASGTGHRIRGNEIFLNAGQGIDLSPNGVTANDAGDGDTGANNRQNFPVLNEASIGSITIGGSLNSNASTTFALDFFASTQCDGSNGEGARFLGSIGVTTNGSGNATFSAELDAEVTSGEVITATATHADGSTSEFSACFSAGAAPVETIGGSPGVPGDVDGSPAVSRLNEPTGMHEVGDLVYLADTSNNKVKAIDLSGATPTLVTLVGLGAGSPGYNGDGIQADTARLNAPRDVFVTATNMYIADTENCRVRKVVLATNIISTVAGTGTCGYNGDDMSATAAQLNKPAGVTVGSDGDIYIADRDNNRVRKIDVSTGKIFTAAGTGSAGFSGDGAAATSAALNKPNDVFPLNEDIVIADTENHRVRRLDLPAGTITTIAGEGFAGFSGDGGPAIVARLNRPTAVAVAENRVMIADTENNRVRRVNTLDGIIDTFMGTGGVTQPVTLNKPEGVTTGSTTASDTNADVVRRTEASPGGPGDPDFEPAVSCNTLPEVSSIDFALPVLLLGGIVWRKRLGALFTRLLAIVRPAPRVTGAATEGGS